MRNTRNKSPIRKPDRNGRIMILGLILTMFERPRPRLVLVCLALVASGCATTGKNLDETALAFVDGEPVTVQDLQESFETSHRGHTVLLAGPGAVHEFLNKTIDRRLLIQEAQRIGLDQDPGIRQEVDTRVIELARDLLYEDEVTRHAEVTERAVQEVYPKIIYQYKVRHILTYTQEDAEKALTRVRAGEAFGAVASQVSVSGTAGKGGDLGFVAWGQLSPRLEAEVEVMKPGEIRGPIETDQGWNVLLLEEKTQREDRPELANLRNRIKAILSKRTASQRSHEYYDELRKRWSVQVFEEALSERSFFGTGTGGRDADRAKQIIVAKAGDHTINLADLEVRLNVEALEKLPWSFAIKRIRDVLDEVIFASLLKQEALRRGYASKPEVARGGRKLENALLFDRLLGTVIVPRVQVTEEDVRAFYEQNPKLYTEPETVRLQIIALENEQEAEAALQEVRSGTDFATLARRRSKDPGTAQVGGELGWVTKGRLDPAIEAVAFSLKVGEAGVAKKDKASFVVKLEGLRPARLQEFSQVKEKARESLLSQRRKEEVNRWIARLREGSEIVIDDGAIKHAVVMYEDLARKKAAAKPPGSVEATKETK
jgi:parvulin-like peptidyl-prolyl isomerase